jgi:uridylate kinase
MIDYRLMPTQNIENASAPIVISLGGSLVVPSGIDTDFLVRFKSLVVKEIQAGRRFVLIVGGGRTARNYIDAANSVTPIDNEDKDWLGIHSTRLNAHLLRAVFYEHAHPEIVTNPEEIPYFTEPLLIGAGYRPGNSTDFVAVKIAEKLGGTHVINLSNIEQVYTADPRTNPNAVPIDHISWADYIALIPSEWSPGLSTPFDPVASRAAQSAHITVSILNGADLTRLEQCLRGDTFVGSTISN